MSGAPAPIEVTLHGQTIGFYISVPKQPNQSERAALLEAGRRMQEEMARLGITEPDGVNELSHLAGIACMLGTLALAATLREPSDTHHQV